MVVDAAHPASFGELLRQHRLDAGLTQAALAERAGVSVRALQYLERSAGQPQRETTRRLAEALALTSEHRARFEQAGVPTPRLRAASDRAGQHLARKRDSQDGRGGEVVGAERDLNGEYKPVTILVADIAGLTDSVQGFEPDLADRLLAGAIPRLVDVVHRYEGTVNRAGGDGIMALFGAPVAHEDDAVRACYAALAMHESFRRYAHRVFEGRGIEMALRVGLDSGEVVIRTASNDLYREYAALGPAVRLATRLGQLAEVGATLLTQATLRLAEGYVHVRPFRPASTGGPAEPITVFELTGPRSARTRFERVVGTRQLTRFVGRRAELEILSGALSRARGGHGQVVALVGDPGVGKSRLAWELTHSRRTDGCLVLECGSMSYSSLTAYHPVIDLLKTYCRIEARDDEHAIRDKVINKLVNLDDSLRPTLPPLLALLDVPPGDAAWDALDSTQRRRQTLDALRRLILRESRDQPLLLVFEDVHWIDTETQALLDSLVDSLATARILLLVTYRPEYVHGWGSKTYYTQLRVDPLGQESADELLTGLLGDDASLDPLKALLTERTEGNPLFLEECVRSLVEAALLVREGGAYRLAQPVRAVRVPATVQAVLAARVDSLPAEQKRLLQTAAAIGKDVPVALLRAVAERAEGELQREVAALQVAELLYEASLFPELEYTFKHALTHEVAYRGLPQERRRELHARITRAIERLYPDRLAEYVERLAHHAQRAELWEAAADYSHQAGNRARARSAYRAAADHLEHALAALRHAPATHERTEQAIDIRFGLRSALRLLGEHGRIPDLLREAEALAESLGDHRRLAWATYLLSNFYVHDGQHERAIEAGRRVAAAADALDDTQLKVVAYVGVALPRCCLGEYRTAVDDFLRSVAPLSKEQLGERPAESTGSDGIISLANAAWCLAELGAFDEGKGYEEQSIRLAEEAGQPYALLAVLNRSGMLALRQGDTSRLIPRLERALDLVHTQDLPLFAPLTLARLGAAYMQAGRLDDALPLLERTAQLVNAGAAGAELASFVTTVAEGYLRRGCLDASVDMTNWALTMARDRGERGNAAWALRLLAEIAAHRDPPDSREAATHYRDALALARELGMRPLEAHCHLDLGKLYRRAGRTGEAQAELSTAIEMLRAMGMAFWLPEAEAELAQITGVRSGTQAGA
jgi:class 3 adenylate cyclase/tetratricopeptide (TPR) repeat protein